MGALEKIGGEQGTLVLYDAEIIFRNFAGAEGMYNAEGDRNFCVVLDPATAEAMLNDGWNIKKRKDLDDGTPGDYYVQVSVKYRGRGGKVLRPPVMALISSKGRVNLTEHECEIIDWVDIKTADLIIRPNHWTMHKGTANETSGIKAYLKSLFITIDESPLDLKYADVPMAELETGGTLELEGPKNQSPDEDEDIVDGELVG